MKIALSFASVLRGFGFMVVRVTPSFSIAVFHPKLMSSLLRSSLLLLLCSALASSALAAAAPKPLKVLLVTGGCCHDYAKQKDILKAGLEARANVIVDQLHTDDKSTRPPLACLTDPNYAKGYDVVIHDECAAGITEVEMVNNVLKPHLEGIPAVLLHCAMHSYRVSPEFRRPQAPGSPAALWFDLVGLQSSGHGPKEPIAITFTPGASPITVGMENWTTTNDELYNNVQPPANFPGHRSLATGRQTVKTKQGTISEVEAVVIWTNEFGPKKTRVFATTLGHFNEMVENPRYLDLLTRGLLWSAGKLEANGKPSAGYAAVKR